MKYAIKAILFLTVTLTFAPSRNALQKALEYENFEQFSAQVIGGPNEEIIGQHLTFIGCIKTTTENNITLFLQKGGLSTSIINAYFTNNYLKNGTMYYGKNNTTNDGTGYFVHPSHITKLS